MGLVRHVTTWVLLLQMVSVFASADPATILAFDTIRNDTMNAPTVKTGTIPAWLKGYFLRQSCGTLGQVRSMADGNYVQHLFDCIPMHTQFRIDGSTDSVTFYNRYPPTVTADIWRHYKMNMNDSKVYFHTVFSAYDVDQKRYWSSNYSNSNKIGDMSHVTWWEIDNNVLAMGEHINVEKVDLPTLDISKYRFRDKDLGYPPNTHFANNPAHAHTEEDKTMWSTVVAMEMDTASGKPVAKQAIYRIRDNYRTVVGEYVWGNFDLSTCGDGGRTPYSDLSVRAGYMHSFCMTENYIILPASGWLLDYCGMFVSREELPYFTRRFQWYSNATSKLIVMRKSDGFIVKAIETEAFFSTHQLNSYEKDGKIYLDMLTYPNADIYMKYTFVKNLLNQMAWVTRVERFVIDMADWTLVERRRLYARDDALEFSNINYEHYNTKPYTYAYVNNRPFLNNGGIIKLNVDTGEAVEYLAPSGVVLNEPIFVSAPDPASEDDGVLLVQGLDANIGKGFMSILDAKSMSQISHVVAPDRALVGLHNKFFHREMAPPVNAHASGADFVHSIAREYLHAGVLTAACISYLHLQ